MTKTETPTAGQSYAVSDADLGPFRQQATDLGLVIVLRPSSRYAHQIVDVYSE